MRSNRRCNWFYCPQVVVYVVQAVFGHLRSAELIPDADPRPSVCEKLTVQASPCFPLPPPTFLPLPRPQTLPPVLRPITVVTSLHNFSFGLSFVKSLSVSHDVKPTVRAESRRGL
jgi:hypothetical protein